jgi:hypothetical protein
MQSEHVPIFASLTLARICGDSYPHHRQTPITFDLALDAANQLRSDQWQIVNRNGNVRRQDTRVEQQVPVESPLAPMTGTLQSFVTLVDIE